MRQIQRNVFGFTLIELLVSIIISALVLGGIFFFISETLLGLARSSTQSDFLRSFYNFSSILNTGEFTIINQDGYDVGLLVSPGTQNGILLGVVSADTLRLIPPANAPFYDKAVIGYRQMSSSEIASIISTPSLIYTFDFFPDKTFSDFYVKDFTLFQYNLGKTTELELQAFPNYQELLKGTEWNTLKIDDLFTYSLVF